MRQIIGNLNVSVSLVLTILCCIDIITLESMIEFYVVNVHTVYSSFSSSIGAQILKKMGWREGQGVGPRIRKYKKMSKGMCFDDCIFFCYEKVYHI